jgi:hypothetical protein
MGVQRGEAPELVLSEVEGVGVWGYPPDWAKPRPTSRRP